MSKTATLTQQYQLTGDGDSIVDSAVTTNSAASPPSIVSLTATDNAVTVPAGATTATLKPPIGSSNVKSVKALAADSNPGGWTTQTVTYPCAGLASFYVHSAGAETLEIWWC